MAASDVYEYGTPLDPQAWNRMEYDKKQKQLESEIGRGDKVRRRTAGKTNRIANDRRRYYYGMVAPLEQKMSADAISDLTTDRRTISDRAMSDVSRAFERARGATQRMRERYGLKVRPEEERIQNIEEARAKVNAGNQAVDDTRDRGTQRAETLGRLGMGMPGQAASAMNYAGQAKANQFDFQAMQTSSEITDKISGDLAGSSAIASMFADGGEVGEEAELEPIKKLRELLTGTRERPTHSINRDQNKKLRDLDEGRYADGGPVGLGMRGAVPLDTGDYVIPADVVQTIGPEFFEKLMEEAEAFNG